ncbi:MULTISPECIES: PP2C family protein-serine/threonine phosphatase [Salinibaculum]|uniref:PP2C family protein-serine/threonine phosphatase n=1 Tax=Salinibaculum TaxID=2732368 RepID=UPI0030D2209A
MRYATNYDIGERKRESGINEDSIALTVFEQGHREGYRGQRIAVDPTERDGDGDGRDRPANRGAAGFVLADGAGGHDAGDVASYIATTVVCEQLANVVVRAARADPDPFDVDVERTPEVPDEADLRGAIEDAIVAAHQAIVANAAETGVGAYTTVVAGIVVEGRLHYGWVGDSRAYLVNCAQSDIARLTRDHSVVEELHREGELDDAEAHVHPRGNEITRALGGTGTENPETASVAVETESVDVYAEDILLVTSDGLIDAQTDAPHLHEEYVESDRSEDVAERIREAVVTDAEIRDTVLDAESLDDAAASLVELSNDRGGKDNLSALLLRDGAFPATPEDAEVRFRDVDETRPVEDRETVIVDE